MSKNDFGGQIVAICDDIIEQEKTLSNSEKGKEHLAWATKVIDKSGADITGKLDENDSELLSLIEIDASEQVVPQEKKTGFLSRIFRKKETVPEELPAELIEIDTDNFLKKLDENDISPDFFKEIKLLENPRDGLGIWLSKFVKNKDSDGYRELRELTTKYKEIKKLEEKLAKNGLRLDTKTESQLNGATSALEKAAAIILWMRKGRKGSLSPKQEEFANAIGKKHNLSRADWVNTNGHNDIELPDDNEPVLSQKEIAKKFPKYKKGIADRAKMLGIQHSTAVSEIPKGKQVCTHCGYLINMDDDRCAVCKSSLD